MSRIGGPFRQVQSQVLSQVLKNAESAAAPTAAATTPKAAVSAAVVRDLFADARIKLPGGFNPSPGFGTAPSGALIDPNNQGSDAVLHYVTVTGYTRDANGKIDGA